MTIRSSVSFIFSPDLKQVLLIQKNRPADQAGTLNGVGGKCEGEETFLHCISREVWEETSLSIAQKNWTLVGLLDCPGWRIKIFTTVLAAGCTAETITDEVVAWYDVNALPTHCQSNLYWLIPLSLNILQRQPKLALTVNIKYLAK